MKTIEITPCGFGALTLDEIQEIAKYLLKAGYTNVGISRVQPKKGKPYVYTLRASVSDEETLSSQEDKDS